VLEICLRIDEVRTSSLRYSFWIFAEADPSRAVIAHGTFGIIHVELDTAAHQIRKTPVHDDLRAKLATVMAAPAPVSAS
jgi:acyl-CoA thioesterase FadM